MFSPKGIQVNLAGPPPASAPQKPRVFDMRTSLGRMAHRRLRDMTNINDSVWPAHPPHDAYDPRPSDGGCLRCGRREFASGGSDRSSQCFVFIEATGDDEAVPEYHVTVPHAQLQPQHA